jgi:hypothetical protein
MLGRILNDNIESWGISHFEAKDHTFQTLWLGLWCVDFFWGPFFVINFSKKNNYPKFG